MHCGDQSIGKDRGAAQKDSCDMTEAEAKEAAEVEWQGWSATGRLVASHYIDDCYVSTLDTFENHLEAVRSVFKRLEAVGFGARVDKVEFVQTELQMLGWRVTEGRVTTDRSKVYKIIKEIGGIQDELVDRKDVMSALGALNFYRSMIPNARGISAPLY